MGPVAAVGAPNDPAIPGSEGRRMFVASVPRAASDAKMARKEPEASPDVDGP